MTAIEERYLFSACIPSSFEEQQTLNICKDVADGNDYRDYQENEDDPSSNRFKGTSMATWVIIVIVVASVLCCICSMSCYYNYKIFKTGEQPWNVPTFCPECLFPRVDNEALLRPDYGIEESMDSQRNSEIESN